MGFIDSRQSINKPFKRTEDTIGKGTFPFKNTGHVKTQRLCAKQYQCKEEKNLKPAVRCHDQYFPIKTFRGAATRTPDKRAKPLLQDQAPAFRSFLRLFHP